MIKLIKAWLIQADFKDVRVHCQDSTNIIPHINRLKEKAYMIIPFNAEK